MARRFSNSMDIKRQNLADTLREILSCENISLLDLTRKLSLSGTSVLQNVKNLTSLGLAREVGSYESTGGRKARAYAPIKDARLAIGLDLTRNHVGGVLINLGGGIDRFQRQRVKFSMDAAYFENLGGIVKELASGVEDRVLGVGIALPGIVDNADKILRYSHVLDLRDVSTDIFSAHIPFGCQFINDANAAGLAEVNGEKNAGMLVYLSLSSSVGGAIIPDGAIYQGQDLRAGEFGHMTIVPNGRQCYCGKLGCLDAYCASSHLAAMADGSLENFFAALAAGDAAKSQAWRECLYYLAIAVNNINMVMDCPVVVGGYLGAYLEEFGGDFLEILASRNTFGNDTSWLRYCRYKKEAAAVGAALSHVNNFINSISMP